MLEDPVLAAHEDGVLSCRGFWFAAQHAGQDALFARCGGQGRQGACELGKGVVAAPKAGMEFFQVVGCEFLQQGGEKIRRRVRDAST
jgi:hypothetical protein